MGTAKPRTIKRDMAGGGLAARLPVMVAAATVLGLPFVISNRTLDPTLLPRFIVLAAALLICAVVFLGPGRSSARVSPAGFPGRLPVLAMGGYLLLTAVSIFPATNFAEAVFEFLKTCLWAGGITIFAVIIFNNPAAIRPLCRMIIFAAGGISLIGLGQYAGLAFAGLPGSGSLYATMANKNQLAGALCLMFPFTLYVILRGGTAWRIGAAVAAILSVAVIILSNTRAAWVALLVASVATITAFLLCPNKSELLRRQFFSQRRAITLSIVALVVAAAVVSSPLLRHHGQSSVTERLRSIIAMSDRSTHERLTLWTKSLEMAAESPWLGVGPGNWKLTIPRYGTEDLRTNTGEILYQRPHNDYLWVLTESGVFALLCYLAIFVVALASCFRLIRQGRDLENVSWAVLLVFGLSVYLTLAFFTFPRERIVHLLFSSLMLGLVSAIHARTFPAGQKLSRRFRVFVLGSIVLCCVCSLIVGVIRLNAEIYTRRALAARSDGDWPAVIQNIDQAISPLAPLDPTSTPLAWYRGSANFSLGRFDQALDDFTVAYRAHPNHIHVLNNLAACYSRKSEHQDAIKYYQEALVLFPLFEETLINLAATYYNAGQYNNALTTMQQIDSTTADPRYRQYLDQIRRKLGQP